MLSFNTAGPCDPRWHYMLPPEDRLPDARRLVDSRSYFVLHAPRQSGKTTTLRALAKALTAEGTYAALHFSCEVGEVARDHVAAQRAVLASIAGEASLQLPADFQPPGPGPSGGDETLLGDTLRGWARTCPRPLVLFFDEIDALRGDSLLSVLRQLRAGFHNRPEGFPHAVVLCGLRDVRDYRVASGGDPGRLGTSSPFNIKVASLRLGDFTDIEVRALYAQHTAATGQAFSDEALERAFSYTQGQPWLTNALAREVVEVMGVSGIVTAHHVDAAKERLVLARQTHLDSLVARLTEPRVRSVIEPLLSGESNAPGDSYDDDLSFVLDLGLIARQLPLRIANPIYREVIVRVLALRAEAWVTDAPPRFVRVDGSFDFPALLLAFVALWGEHGDALATSMPYPEVTPHLVFMALCHRLVNGGGFIDREYGIGRGRIDLLIRWPLPDGSTQRYAIELKAWRDGRPDPMGKGLLQLDSYLSGLGLDEGLLVLFDQRTDAGPAATRTRWEQATTATGRAVRVLRA
jgi:hypothetical protein